MPSATAGAWVALGPGSLVLDADGPLGGRVVSVGFRRGITELAVEVDGVGEVTVVSPNVGGARRALPGTGDAVRLRAEPGALAVVPG